MKRRAKNACLNRLPFRMWGFNQNGRTWHRLRARTSRRTLCGSDRIELTVWNDDKPVVVKPFRVCSRCSALAVSEEKWAEADPRLAAHLARLPRQRP